MKMLKGCHFSKELVFLIMHLYLAYPLLYVIQKVVSTIKCLLKKYNLNAMLSIIFFCFTLAFTASNSYATSYTTVSQDSLPWESPLCILANSLTGGTSKAIVTIALMVTGGLLVFGGELSDFGRRITWLVLAASIMLSGTIFLDMINSKVLNCSSDQTPGTVQPVEKSTQICPYLHEVVNVKCGRPDLPPPGFINP
jgi:type IV secretion system protein TrbC